MNSIFSLRQTKDEPYLTQVFSFLLNSDEEFCNFLITNVFNVTSAGAVKTIEPERLSDSGRPDIAIKCENARIAIENKIGAEFTKDQVPRYQKDFDYVFLFYKFLKDRQQANFCTESFTWYKIYSEVKRYIKSLPHDYDLIDRFILNQFTKYLEESGMGIEKVSWEIINGTKSLFNLYPLMAESFERLVKANEIESCKMCGQSYWYYGWEVVIDEQDSFYVYLIYNPFNILTCFHDDKQNYSPNYKPLREKFPDLNWQHYWYLAGLDLNKTRFFCMSADEQVEALTEFIKDSKQEYFRGCRPATKKLGRP